MPSRALVALCSGVAALALAGCAAPAAPSPSPSPSPSSGLEPATLAELEAAIVDEGPASHASLEVVASPGQADRLQIDLIVSRATPPEGVADVVASVQQRASTIVSVSGTTIVVAAAPGEALAHVRMEDDLGRQALTELWRIVTTTPCLDASTAVPADADEPEGGEPASAATASLACAVEAADAPALVAQYDAITAIAPQAATIGATVWTVSPAEPHAAQPDATRPTSLSIDMGPIEGRAELLLDLATIADEAGATGLTITDSGERLSITGVLDADQGAACDALWQRLLETDVERAAVRFGTDGASGAYDVCSLDR